MTENNKIIANTLEVIEKVRGLLDEGNVEKAKESLGTLACTCLDQVSSVKDKENENFQWFLGKLDHDAFAPSPNSDDVDLGDKEIWVYWSGGYDSTALVTALWRKYNKPIHTFSVFHNLIPNKYSDRKARRLLLKEFRKRNWEIGNVELELKDEYYGGNNGLGQPAVWLSALGAVLRSNDRAICFGYVRYDDIWHYIEPFKNIFNSFCSILGSKGHALLFPLEFVEKKDIIKYLKQEGLDHLCNCCEQETDEFAADEPCGHCSSCMRHQQALEELEKEEQFIKEAEDKHVEEVIKEE